MPMGAGDAAGKFSAGPATGDECRLERGRVWVFDDGLLAGGGVEGGDRGQGPTPRSIPARTVGWVSGDLVVGVRSA